MNQAIHPLELIVRDISPSQNPAVILTANPSLDEVTAAIMIYFGLSKQGKQASLLCATPVTYNIHGVEHIKTEFSGNGRNLVISFPYSDGSIDKVDYRIENNTFNLIVIPREGFDKITPDQMKYSYQGGKPDTIITVGAENLQSLGAIYKNNQEALDTLPLVSISKKQPVTQFGSSEYSRDGAMYIELANEVLNALEIQIDPNIATIALAGLTTSTANFSNEMSTPEAFELAGKLMRSGAQKRPYVEVTSPSVAGTNLSQNTAPNRRAISNPQSDDVLSQAEFRHSNTPPSNPANTFRRNVGQTSAPQNVGRPTRPERSVSSQNPKPNENTSYDAFESEASDMDGTHEDTAETKKPNNPSGRSNGDGTPQDWLKPKIFKGGGFI